jgi:hypothetical protein
MHLKGVPPLVIKDQLRHMLIPMNLATQSAGIWPVIPIERGH